MITVEEIQYRILELKTACHKAPEHSDRYEHTKEYLQDLIYVNEEVLRTLLSKRH